MFDVEIRRTFAAAHQLKGYPGNCRNLHGHNYAVIATIRCAKLNEIGIALDFRILKQAVDEILDNYDHQNLSELPEFQTINPTSEVLAMTIYHHLQTKLEPEQLKVQSVKVFESENSAVTYFED